MGSYSQTYHKKCNACQQIRPEKDFYAHQFTADGLSFVCRFCITPEEAQRRLDDIRVWRQIGSSASNDTAAQSRFRETHSLREVNKPSVQVNKPSTQVKQPPRRDKVKSKQKATKPNPVASKQKAPESSEDTFTGMIGYLNAIPKDLQNDLYIYSENHNLPIGAIITEGCRIILDFGDNLDGLFDYCNRNGLQISEALEFAIQLMLRDERRQYRE